MFCSCFRFRVEWADYDFVLPGIGGVMMWHFIGHLRNFQSRRFELRCGLI